MALREFQEIIEYFPNLKGLALCGMYEPLADNRLDDILSLIEKLKPNCEVVIFTNGQFLRNTNRKMLLSHPCLKNIVISIHGFTKETYEKIMIGLDRDTVYENVQALASAIHSFKLPIKLSVSFVRIKQNVHELPVFREFWKDKVDVVSDFEVMNWRGEVPAEDLLYDTPKHTRPCPMYEQPLVIDAYGNVVRCCYDFTFNYGHVLRGGLENWQNKKWESQTYPTVECKPCHGWHFY
jgi:hypothetical protein